MVLGGSLCLGGSLLILLAMSHKAQGDQHRSQHAVHGSRQEQHHHLHGPHRDSTQPHQHAEAPTGRGKHEGAGQEKFLFEKYEARRQYMRSDAEGAERVEAQGEESDVPPAEVSLPEDTKVDLMEIMDHLEELREMFALTDNAEIQEALAEASSMRNENWMDEISEEMLEKLRRALIQEDPQILERLAIAEETVPEFLAELLRSKQDRNQHEADEGEDDRKGRMEEGPAELGESPAAGEQEPGNENVEMKDGRARTPVQEEKGLRTTDTGNKSEPDEGFFEEEEPRRSEGDAERGEEMFEDMAASGNGRDALELLKLMSAESSKGLVPGNPVLSLVQPEDMAPSSPAENRFSTNEEIIQIVSLEEGKSGRLGKDSDGEGMRPTLPGGEGARLEGSRRHTSGRTEGDESRSSSELRSHVEDEHLLEDLRQKTLDLIQKSRRRYSAEDASKAIEFMEMIFISSPGRDNEDKPQAPASKGEAGAADAELMDGDQRRLGEMDPRGERRGHRAATSSPNLKWTQARGRGLSRRSYRRARVTSRDSSQRCFTAFRPSWNDRARRALLRETRVICR
ncbi:hypothetical protein C7M84_020393 [Penaeus vannamei]|uniref:Uncharacterized protein n=1 Tax=Penaeus vannamei TaxID=6689 RepID=A0A423SC68_PENVA|nr:hypothetical protein C7M84_020393 [Penaeus vannamei]